MIETNRFQILNPDILEVITDQRKDKILQITYMLKRCSEAVLFSPPPHSYYLNSFVFLKGFSR